jgi:hypothetical protein
VKAILDLEEDPQSFTLPDGKHVRFDGRTWLRTMSKAFKDNVGVETVIKPENEQLKKRGKPPFPTHPKVFAAERGPVLLCFRPHWKIVS